MFSERHLTAVTRRGTFLMTILNVNEPAFENDESLRRVKSYVIGHFRDGGISLQMAAAVACLEPKHFSKFFHRKVCVTFRSWLRQIRVGEARKLIEENEKSITEIAFQVGYQDLGTFERAFKSETSLCPKHYRHLLSAKNRSLPQ